MRLAPVQRVAKPVAVTASVPAPVGGWNARDSIANMPPEDAVSLVNLFPSTSDVMLMKGWDGGYATGLPNQTESLLVYNGGGTSEMYAVSGGSFYDVSSPGAVGAPVVTGQSNSRWQSANISTSGGNFMMSVNGVDDSLLYDGASFAAATFTGVAVDEVSNVTLFKNRLWFIERQSLNAWYLPVDSIAGLAVKFPLGGIARKGGYLVSFIGWTIDAGEGVDDYFAFITSQGEVIVYKGGDPSTATDWFLQGVWTMGAPIGAERCVHKYGGDVMYLCVDGLVPMSQALLSSRTQQRVAITDKIVTAMNDAILAYGANFGWETVFYPKGQMILLNVPVSTGANQEQYVMNTDTKSWGQFIIYPANCFAVFNDDLYFGGNLYVAKAWTGTDNNGANITGNVQQSFNYFGARGQLKLFKMIRPTFSTDGSPAVALTINVDYQDEAPDAAASFSPDTASAWDSALWDVGIWGGGLNVVAEWQTVGNIGYCGALRMQIESKGIEVHWQVTDYIMEKGGIL